MLTCCLATLLLLGGPAPGNFALDDDGPAAVAESNLAQAAPAPMGVADARHLLGRAGFGGTIEEIDACAALSREAAVDALLASLRTESLLPPPEFVITPRANRTVIRPSTDEERKEARQLLRRMGLDLKTWWTSEMLLTDSPFTERLVLFWHDHFVSDLQKVRDPDFLWQQNALFRRHAAGNFRTLLREISLDPAMVLYLDTQQNQRGKPNENYARELLELFTLGEGHYTEQDIKEAARAFTGWRANRLTGTVQRVDRRHDSGEKTFLGETGRFGVDDILRIILEQERTAEFLVEELWRDFVSPEPPPRAEVVRLAAVLRDGDYELQPLYRALLLTPAFWTETNRGALIRSPIDVVVGSARFLGLERVPAESLQRAAAGMGQNIFDPPNVKGWPGGDRWITSSSLLSRKQFLERALTGLQVRGQTRGSDRAGSDGARMEPEMEPGMEGERPRARRDRRRPARPTSAMARLRDTWVGLGDTDDIRAEALTAYLCPLPPVFERPEEGESAAKTLSRLILDPTYQLK